MVFTKPLLENSLAIRPCNYGAASEPLLPKFACCIPVLSSRYIGKCATRVLKHSGWIFSVSEVAFILVLLSIFFRASCTDGCRHCTKPMITGLYPSYELLFIFIFEFVSNRLLSVNPFLYSLYRNGSPLICDSQVGFSAGGNSLSPRSL